MMYNIEHIRGLMFERLSGTISDNDELFLTDAICNDPDINSLWLNIQKELSTTKGVSFISGIDENNAWNYLRSTLKSRNKIKRLQIVRWTSAAAVLITGVYLGFFTNRTKPYSTTAVSNKKNNYHVELQLLNGQKIDLSDTSNRVIDLAFARIKKGAKGFIYEASGNNSAEWSTLVVPAKQDYKIILSDGTEVWLNSTSKLRFPFFFTSKNREVYIEGEAFFKVAKNPLRPFIVHTAQTDIRVLGTSFNVNTYEPGKTVTSLTEGMVKSVAGRKDSTILKPGFQTVYTIGNHFKTAAFDESTELGWMRNMYYFHNTQLGAISAVLSRWFDMEVVFDNEATAKQTFSGAIEKNNLSAFLQNLQISANIETYTQSGVLHIK